MDVADLYRALEFSHYAERYRDNILAIAISLNTPFRDLALDFKVLTAYGMKGVFGVGINPKLEQKLTPLGFSEVQHSELPQAWQDQYDSSRPSRAFALTL